MKFLTGVSFRWKLFLMAIIPVLALVYLVGQEINELREQKNSSQKLVDDVKLIRGITDVIHELQKERALTAVAGSSGSPEFFQQLVNQRENTDRSITSLHLIEAATVKKSKLFDTLKSLNIIRTYHKKDKISNKADEFYETAKENLLLQIDLILESSKDSYFKNLTEKHLFLTNGKDFLARIRTWISNAISKNHYSTAELVDFAALKGKFDFNIRQFHRVSNENAGSGLDSFINSSPLISQTFSTINSFYNQKVGEPAKIDFTDWWAISTSTINRYKELEDESLNQIENHALLQLESAESALTKTLLFSTLITLLIALFLFYTIRAITHSVNQLKTGADKLAKGEVDFNVEINSRDEIGELAESFNKMVSVTKEFTDHAYKIGTGNYETEIPIRGEKDALGSGLEKMRRNLKALLQENNSRNWLLSGTGELNNEIRGERELRDLTSSIINKLCKYLGIHTGAIYVMENGQLQLSATYAYDIRKHNQSTIKPGEGFVGQAALEKQLLVFTNIPEEYFRVNSALGNAVPKNLLVFPLLFNNEVKGVVELGSLHDFTELQRQFIEMVSENIAIALHGSQSRTMLKEFLEETQRQAEELEAQQEELRQTNEELTEKTDMLERSESELRSQQEELSQINLELEQKAKMLEDQKTKLENTKIELETKARELESTSKYKSEFLSNMSHELRTPLNSILILAQLLAENKDRHLGEKESEFAANIYSSGQDLLNLINEILDLAKVESGKLSLELEEVKLSDIVSNAKAMFTEVAASKGIQFNELSIHPGLDDHILTDKLRLEQILRNLFSNAFKFTNAGGEVSLSIRPAQKGAIFNNRNLNGLKNVIAFTVRDTGIGIPSSKHQIIFEAFQQADGSTKRKYGGTGLGLSICKELADALGGEIQIESEEGKGSSFTLFLPKEYDKSNIVSDKPGIEVNNKIKSSASMEEEFSNDDRYNLQENDKMVLVVEDDKPFAKLLLSFIRERGFKGIVTGNGDQVLELAERYKPDAIILDMKLPGKNGDEILKELKGNKTLRKIPVQIISAYDHRKEGMQMGAFDFLHKPVKREQFFKSFGKIESVVNKTVKTVLIVEGNPNQNKVISDLLEGDMITCTSAFSAEEAYKNLDENEFDCIILDHSLPDESGINFLKKIRSQHKTESIPVIVYSDKEISQQEANNLTRLADTIVMESSGFRERLINETTLFLHNLESRIPKLKQTILTPPTDEMLLNKKVLIVDDDIRNIYSLTNALEKNGSTCFTADTGKAAIDLLSQEEGIDIVLMDIMMPEMDGYEATRQIRSNPALKDLPVIALTAKAMKGDREKCLDAGMSDYISKPVNIDQLLSLMRIWIYR